MKCSKGLVVVSHPNRQSLNHALAKAIVNAWERSGVTTQLLDLHAIDFDPVLDLNEVRGHATDDPLVLSHIRLLQACDLLAVVHPNCWGAPPAMMKGWMDRIFAPNAAYAFPKGADDGERPIGLLGGKRALVVNTSNTSQEREDAVFGDPLERIWRDCILSYCGFERIERQVFRIIATSTHEQRTMWIEQASMRATALAAD